MTPPCDKWVRRHGQGTEIGPEGKLPIGDVPHQPVAPLISYTRGHDVQSKSVISILPTQGMILHPCESEVILSYYRIKSSSRNTLHIP
jgi:hypothetical protein